MVNLVDIPLMVVALLMPVSIDSSAWGQIQSPIAINTCIQPIGRIINVGKSRQFCEADEIEVNDDTLIVCYSSQRLIKLQSGFYKAVSVCTPSQTNARRKCTPITLRECPNRKGPDDNENAPNIIQPYGKIMINNRPLISWSAVPEATSYTVQVNGSGVNWQKEVNGTILPYPQDEKELVYGSAIKLVVIANKGNSPISADTLVVHLLPEKEVTQINQAVERIKKLGLSADETAYLDLDAIYMSKGILNKTIETLEARVAAGSFNPILYRILGDRYVEAWLPEQAKRVYTKALQLARFQRNLDEAALAQERLRSLTQSQLPTRMNAAQ